MRSSFSGCRSNSSLRSIYNGVICYIHFMAVVRNCVVICPVRDNMLVEEITLRTRPRLIRDGIW